MGSVGPGGGGDTWLQFGGEDLAGPDQGVEVRSWLEAS